MGVPDETGSKSSLDTLSNRLDTCSCLMYMCLQGPISKWATRASNQDPLEGRLDAEAAAQAHINAVSGACLALGIKYAGSASEAAQKLLHAYVMYFLTGKQAAPDPVSGDMSFGYSVTFQILATKALGKSLVPIGHLIQSQIGGLRYSPVGAKELAG